MDHAGLIYLDNAATTFPKPKAVNEAVWDCLTRWCGNAGRSSHALAMAAAERTYDCRCLAAQLFGVSEAERVFFTLNTTHGLNTVIKGLLRPGDHVLISDLEHNAVYRPIYKLAAEGRITYDIFRSMTGDPRQNATRICAGIARLLRPNTRLLVCTHASNICSATLPIRQIGAFCHRHGIFFVVDGAQSAGHEPIAVDDMQIDALCVPGHKGLYGPQGCGMVILGKKVSPQTLIEGGNGVDSLAGEMSGDTPERYEAGTLPLPAIAGLYEGMRAISSVGIKAIAEHERTLCRAARTLLLQIPTVELYAPDYEGTTLLFHLQHMPSDAVGNCLNEYGICVRSGYHCAPLAHRTLRTPEDGAVRISFGMYNRMSEVEALASALKKLAKNSL